LTSAGDCKASAGWRMQGTYIDSGAESGDASSTELVYTVVLAKSGSIQFTYTSDGERYHDYLRNSILTH
jgi:hypothetical protein